MAIAANTRRSWLRPRFSLRVLMLAVTTFAVGFPVWYRWPYRETEQLPPPLKAGPKTIDEKRVTTWRRQWGGGRLKHGPTQQAIEGQTYLITTYQNGLKHGPYLNYRFDILPDGNGLKFVRTKAPYTVGQYVDDEKDGVWTEIVGDEKTVTTWHNGKQVAP